MERLVFQCPTCSHVESEQAYWGYKPDDLCPGNNCHETVMAQYQKRKIKIPGERYDDSQ